MNNRETFGPEGDVARKKIRRFLLGGAARRGIRRRHPAAVLAYPHPLKLSVRIGWVLHPLHFFGPQKRPQHFGLHAEQRPEEQNIIARRPPRHAFQAKIAPRRPHRHGFRLVAAMVAEQEKQRTDGPGGLRQRRMARRARGFLQPRAAQKIKGKDFRLNPHGLEPVPDQNRFRCGIRAQPMVDNQGQNTAAVPPRPFPRQQSQGGAVGTARNRNGEFGRRPERPKPRHRRRKFSGQLQCARWLAASISPCIPFGGVGNWLFSEARVSHAAAAWWMAVSELARPSNAPGA